MRVKLVSLPLPLQRVGNPARRCGGRNSQMNRIKFGIIGLGRIGPRHAAHIVANESAELTAICDIDEQKAKPFADQSLRFYTDYQAMLQAGDLDVVSVCTPNYLHAAMCIRSLSKGYHTICEKPMATKSEDCNKMISAALDAQKQLFVVKQNRYNPPVAAVKKLLEEGRLGKVYQVSINCFWNRNENYYLSSDWKGKKEKDGGCLYTQCSHFVDIMYYLFGNVNCLSGIVKNVGHGQLIEFEDSGSFLLESEDGAIINFNFSTCTFEQNMEGSITIIAEKGTVKIGGQYLNTIDYQKIENYEIENLKDGALCNDYGDYKGSMSNHDKVIENVINTIQGKARNATNGLQGMKVVQIIESMYKAAKRD